MISAFNADINPGRISTLRLTTKSSLTKEIQISTLRLVDEENADIEHHVTATSATTARKMFIKEMKMKKNEN